MRPTLLVILAACGSSGRSAPDAAGTGDAAGGPPGAACGGPARLACSASQYCDYADNGCGIGDQTGTCTPRPAACPLVILGAPVCACDAKVYAGDCAAYLAGVDLDAHGTCPIVAGKFACGYTQCDLATQYCLREPHLAGAENFTCVSLSCAGTPSCACLATERCGNSCTGDPSVGLTLTCSPSA